MMTDVPSPDYALERSQHRNILILLHKPIDTHLLPFMFDDTSVARAYKVLTECFLKAENRICQLLTEAQGLASLMSNYM